MMYLPSQASQCRGLNLRGGRGHRSAVSRDGCGVMHGKTLRDSSAVCCASWKAGNQQDPFQPAKAQLEPSPFGLPTTHQEPSDHNALHCSLPIRHLGSPDLTGLQPSPCTSTTCTSTTLSSYQPHRPVTGRRSTLMAASMLVLGVAGPWVNPGCPPQAQAALIDEGNSVATFASASSALVGVTLEVDGKVEKQGSGFVWDNYGHIVTDGNLVSRKPGSLTKVTVSMPDGQTLEVDAVLCGFTTAWGLGVVRVQDEEVLAAIRPLKLSSSSSLRVGQSVFALGQMGAGKSLSAGIISGLNRKIPSSVGTIIQGVIQTDASINKSNTGGPLVDSSGNVIGLCLVPTYSGQSGSIGINFAIPSDVLVDVVPKLAAFGNALGKA